MEANTPRKDTDFSSAIESSMQVRRLYHELEKRNHGAAWTKQEDVIGFVYDVGELGRMVMAAEGRWVHPGELGKDLGDKLSECLWWLFVLSERLGVDLNAAFASKLSELEGSLSASVASADEAAP